MENPSVQVEDDDLRKLKWLMLSRVLFTLLLLGSSIILQLREKQPLNQNLVVLYWIIAATLLVSLFYSILLARIKRILRFAFIQISVDTFLVTLIILVTGVFSSIFSFLYLIVIIYSSLLLFRNGSMLIATFCSLQYAIIALFQYIGLLDSFFISNMRPSLDFGLSDVLYRIMITTWGCFSVAFLGSLLAERTRATEIELKVMKERIKRVEKLAYMGEMAAGLAHEIRNPLTSLSGSIQLLREELEYNFEHDKLMQIVLREAERLSLLVNNFLLFAKPPMGRAESIELDQILREIVILFEQNTNSRAKISISQDYLPGLWVKMDKGQFRQIIWNLLLNASEAIDAQGKIDLKVFKLRPKKVGISITDNGCGMSDDIINKMFDPFFTTKASGTGLGLSVVHRILESSNGWLDVYSQPGKGTCATLNLEQVDEPTKS
jgi:two-component system sensor histidine kinase HydH